MGTNFGNVKWETFCRNSQKFVGNFASLIGESDVYDFSLYALEKKIRHTLGSLVDPMFIISLVKNLILEFHCMDFNNELQSYAFQSYVQYSSLFEVHK